MAKKSTKGTFENLPLKVANFLLSGKDLDEGAWMEGLEKAITEFKKRELDEEVVLEKVLGTRTEWTDEHEQAFEEFWNEDEVGGEENSTKKRRPPLEDYVSAWLHRNKVKYNFESNNYSIGDSTKDKSYIIDRIYLDADKQGHRFFDNEITKVLDIVEEKAYTNYISEVQELIRYKGPTGETAKFLKTITGKEDRLNLIAVIHNLRAIKQQIMSYPNPPPTPQKYHLFVIFTGGQSLGKSYTFENIIFAPISGLVDWGCNFSVLTDDRQAFRLAKYFVGYFDECSKIPKNDIETIKNSITAKNVNYRKLGTNTSITLPKRMNFIGTSNQDISFLIHDPTGMRRFWQIMCRELPRVVVAPGHEDHDNQTRARQEEKTKIRQALNKIDALKIWQEIDENDYSYSEYEKAEEEMSVEQEKLRTLDPIEDFLKEATEAVDVKSKEATSLTDVYVHYIKYQEAQKVSFVATKKTFSKKIAAFGAKTERRSAGVFVGVKLKDIYE